jgi:hypothetical protein
MNVQFLEVYVHNRVLRLEVSLYNAFITNQFQTNFAWGGGGGGKSVSRGDCELGCPRNEKKKFGSNQNKPK